MYMDTKATQTADDKLNEFRQLAEQTTPPNRTIIGRKFAVVISAYNKEGAEMYGPRSKGAERHAKLINELNRMYKKFGYSTNDWNSSNIVNNKTFSAPGYISPTELNFDARFEKHGNRFWPLGNDKKKAAPASPNSNARKLSPRECDFLPS